MDALLFWGAVDADLASLEPICGIRPLSAFLVAEIEPGIYARFVLTTTHLGDLAKATAQHAMECHDTARGTH